MHETLVASFLNIEALQRVATQAGMSGTAWQLPQVQELKTIVDMDSNPDLEVIGQYSKLNH